MPGDVPRQPTSATTASSSPASTAPRSGATTPMPCARANDATRCDFDPNGCTGSTQRTPASGTTELHPEFRTLPMVWYVPPLSPVVDQVTASGSDGEDHKVLLSAISQMRIPLEYLAGLFTAGDTAPVELALRRLAAMRSYMRDVFVDNPTNEEIPASVGMTPEKVKEMYRLLSIAKYDDRFVIPTAHPEMPRGIKELEGCPVSYDVEAFHGLAPATSNRPMGGSSPEGRQMLPLEVVR